MGAPAFDLCSRSVEIDGSSVPTFFYGTAWKEDHTAAYTEAAVQSGFRAIDTANQRKHYFEEGAGVGLARIYRLGFITRENLFLQTKFTYRRGQDARLPYDENADLTTQVAQSFASSLTHLGTDYLDSYVLHGPWSQMWLSAQDLEVWRAMENLVKDGKTKFLGVSNVGPAQLTQLIDKAVMAPQFVQNRCFAATNWDEEVRSICVSNGIIYQGFSLLTANHQVFERERLQAIAAGHKKHMTQVVFRFAQQIGILPLTGTTNRQNMIDDLDIYDFQLTSEEVKFMTTIARQ